MSISLYMKHIIFEPFLNKNNYNYSLDIDQLNVLKNIIEKNENKELNRDFTTSLRKKFNSYKQQDKLKHKFDETQHITYDEMIHKIYDSQLKCYYCQCDLFILFNKKREGTQWTLERLNNNLGHYTSNTCISCLKCNLKRRTDNHEYFKQGKQFKFIKFNL